MPPKQVLVLRLGNEFQRRSSTQDDVYFQTSEELDVLLDVCVCFLFCDQPSIENGRFSEVGHETCEKENRVKMKEQS